MKHFKKVLTISLCLVVAMISSIVLSACGGNKPQKYYNKTITFTGASYACDWDEVDVFTNKNYKTLLQECYSNIDFTKGPEMWAECGALDVNGFMDYVNQHLTNVYAPFKDISVTLGSATERTATLKVGNKTYNGIFVEEQNQYLAIENALDSKFPKYQLDMWPLNPGFACIILFDTNDDELYDSFAKLNFVSHEGNQTTQMSVSVDPQFESEEFYAYDTVLDTMNYMSDLVVKDAEGTSLVDIRLFPVVTVK